MIGIDALREQAREWAARVVTFYNTPVPADLQADKDAILSYANTVKSTIEKATGPLDELTSMNQIQTLGFWPVAVGAVAIAAAAAAIAGWYYKEKLFYARLDEFNKLMDGGLTYEQSANIVLGNQSLSSNLVTITKYALPLSVISIGAYYYFKRVK